MNLTFSLGKFKGRQFTRLTNILSITSLLLVMLYSGRAFSKQEGLTSEQLETKPIKVPIRILQKRYFKKQFRPELGLYYGGVRDEAYQDTDFWGWRASVFIDESWGIEYTQLVASSKDSADLKALHAFEHYVFDAEENGFVSKTIEPEINNVSNVAEINFLLTPFYGKLNLIDQSILYFDLQLGFGFSKLTTDQGEKVGFNVSIGERFYFSKNWSVRFDIKDRMFNETRANQDSLRHLITVDVGLGYFLW